MAHCILLGKKAGYELTDEDYELRIAIGENNIIGTKMTPEEYKVVSSVIKRCVEKGLK